MKYKKLFLQKSLSLIKHDDKGHFTLKDFLREINLNPKKIQDIEGALSGAFKSKLTGSGFDFNEIREYRIGDDLRHISWNATAKTGILHTKEYFAEKELHSYFLVDISSSMLCGNKLETFIQTFAFLLNLTCNFSEKIGGIFFADDIKYNFPFSGAVTQANLMFDSLIKFRQDYLTASCRTDYLKPVDFTKRYFLKKGFVFIISDLINAVLFKEKFFEISQKQNVYFFQIYDSLDFDLPSKGYVTFFDPETRKIFTVNTDNQSVKKKYNNYMKQQQDELCNFIKSVGGYHFLIERRDLL